MAVPTSRSGSGSRASSGDSVRALPDASDDPPMVAVELFTLDGRETRIEVDPDASIGQLVSKFEAADSCLFDAYRTGWIVFGSPPVSFELSDFYVKFLATKVVREFRKANTDSPLRFQLICRPVAEVPSE